MLRPTLALCIALSLAACGKKAAPPQATTQGTSLNVGPTVMTPEVHINPQGDAGATSVQIGGARVVLPGENDRAAQAEAEQEH